MRVLVVPVKRLDVAKTRLDDVWAAHRTRLALAFAVDTVAAAAETAGVQVVVVTDDEDARAAMTQLGVVTVPDVPDAGLNAALEHAAVVASQRYPGADVGALSADLPALRAHDLAVAIEAGRGGGFVADDDGTGTTLLMAAPGRPLHPRFGTGSAQAHRAAGLAELREALPSLRRDVDTPADLDAAIRLGVGARTRAVLDSIAKRSPH